MSVIRLFLLLNVILANAEVILHDVGKSTVTVEDDQLHVVVTEHTKCRGDLEIHYDVSEVTDADFAVAGDDKLCRMRTPSDALRSTGYNSNSKCPLAKLSGNRLNINAVSLPKNCAVTLKNAELPSAAAKKAQADSLHTALIVGSVLGALIFVGLAIAIALFVWCVGRRWWSRRQERRRQPVEPHLNAEATKTRKRKDKKNKKADDPKITSVTPTPSTTSAVPPPSEAKPNAPVPPPVGKEENVNVGEGKKKAAVPPKPHGADQKYFSGYRAQEAYNVIRARGSSIAEKPAGSKKSQKTDSLEEHYMHVESAVESMARHGFVQQTMGDAAILSRRESKTTPQAFLDMQKWYGGNTKHQVDSRELILLSQLPQDSFGLLEELSKEARTQLTAKGVDFAADNRSATFTKEARAFVAAPTTPAFVVLVAYGAEFGYLVRLQEHLPERERDYRCYSIQLLLLIALNQANTERIRREAFAFMMVKIARQLPKYATSQLEGMAFPMSLVPEVTKQNPEIFQHPEKFQTGWKDTEGCCEKKGTAETTSTPAPAPTTQQERQLDKKPSVTTATTKTSVTEEK